MRLAVGIDRNAGTRVGTLDIARRLARRSALHRIVRVAAGIEAVLGALVRTLGVALHIFDLATALAAGVAASFAAQVKIEVARSLARGGELGRAREQHVPGVACRRAAELEPVLARGVGVDTDARACLGGCCGLSGRGEEETSGKSEQWQAHHRLRRTPQQIGSSASPPGWDSSPGYVPSRQGKPSARSRVDNSGPELGDDGSFGPITLPVV